MDRVRLTNNRSLTGVQLAACEVHSNRQGYQDTSLQDHYFSHLSRRPQQTITSLITIIIIHIYCVALTITIHIDDEILFYPTIYCVQFLNRHCLILLLHGCRDGDMLIIIRLFTSWRRRFNLQGCQIHQLL